MKGLEIVNNRLDALEHKDFGNLGVIGISKKELNNIKQDLEVLEIIRKKEVDIMLLKSLLKEKLILDEILYIMNDEYCKLTMEELLKLKQWLEVNE